MKRITRIAAILAIAAMAVALSAGAQAADKTIAPQGKVVSVDTAANTFVMDEKGGEQLTITVPPKRGVAVYAKAKHDELESEQAVKIYGKVAEDLSAVKTVHNVCLMPSLHYGTDKKSRLEGKYLREGDQQFVEFKGQKIPIEMRAKWSVTKVVNTGLDFLEPGMTVKYFRIYKKGDQWVATGGARTYASRDKLDAYLKNKEK